MPALLYQKLWNILVFFVTAAYDNPTLDNEEQNITMINVVPSGNSYNTVENRPSKPAVESLPVDETPDVIPSRPTDTQRKMAQLGESVC